MTTEQLEKAKRLEEIIVKTHSVLRSLKSETNNPIKLSQSTPSDCPENVSITGNFNSDNEFEKSIRIVLEATKQTIKSLYEREIQRLETEFKNL